MKEYEEMKKQETEAIQMRKEKEASENTSIKKEIARPVVTYKPIPSEVIFYLFGYYSKYHALLHGF